VEVEVKDLLLKEEAVDFSAPRHFNSETLVVLEVEVVDALVVPLEAAEVEENFYVVNARLTEAGAHFAPVP
jgi:hypothetical protein